MTTQTELQSLPGHLRDTGNPTDADLLERAAEDYSALLARNNVLRKKVEELEEEMVCLTTDTPLNERLLTQRRTIVSLQAKLARVEKLPRFEMNVSYPSMHRVSTVGHHATPKGEWVRYADIKQALEQSD